MGEHPISRHSIDERSKPIVGRQDNTQTHREMTQSSPFFICRQINLHQPQQMIHSQGRRKQQKQPTQNQEPQQQTNHTNTPKKEQRGTTDRTRRKKRQTRHDQLPKPTTPKNRNQQNHTPKQQKTKFTGLLHPPGGLRAGSPRFQWFEWNIPNGFCLYKRLIFLVQDFASMSETPDRRGRSVDRG